MFSSDKNVENIATLAEEVRRWSQLKKDSIQLEFADKSSRIVSFVISALVIGILVLLILIYLSFAAAYALEALTGSLALAFLCVSLAYIILLVLFFYINGPMIKKPLQQFAGITGEPETELATIEKDIEQSEKKITQLWNGTFHPTDDEKSSLFESPTQKALNIVSSSANILDGVIFGWKMYRKFKKKRK